MNCQDFEALLTEAARELAGASDRERLLAHIESCPQCAIRLEDERMLSEGLRVLKAGTEAEEALLRIEAELLRAFHQKTPVATVARRSVWLWGAGTVAALLILTAAVGAMLWKQPGTLSGPGRQPQVTAPPAPPKAPPAATRDQLRPKLARRLGGRAVRRVAIAGVTTPRITPAPERSPDRIEFMPIRYGDDLSRMERGQVVRVRLPRSALAPFGLVINEERATDRIKADVLLGEDGTARAIRFVP